MENDNAFRFGPARTSVGRDFGSVSPSPVVTPFGPVQAPHGVRILARPRPMRPTTYERRLQRERAARLQRRIGVACIVLSILTTLYFVAQFARAVLS